MVCDWLCLFTNSLVPKRTIENFENLCFLSFLLQVLERESRTSSIELWDVWSWWASCEVQFPPCNTNTTTIITPPHTAIIPPLFAATRANGTTPQDDEPQGIGMKTFSSGGAGEPDASRDDVGFWSHSPSHSNNSDGTVPEDGKSNDGNVMGRNNCSIPQTNTVTQARHYNRSECTESCNVARRNFISPLYVHQLFLSLLPPGAVDRIKDPVSIAHQTWEQIRRLLFPAATQHLPYDTSCSLPPVYPQLAHEERPPSRSQLPTPLQVDPSIPRLEPWVGLFGQWLPEQGYDTLRGGQLNSQSSRKLTLPADPHLLFWDVIYEMYDTVDNYLNQPSAGRLSVLRDSLGNSLKI